MIVNDGLFTSEAVSAGHPDKLCDRVSDAILDAFLERDANSRVACEVMAADNKIIVAGEFSAAHGVFDEVRERAEDVVRSAIRAVGYGSAELDIDPEDCEVEIRFNHQAPEISRAVDGGQQLGAGDQGIMFGYACDETPELMPLAWSLANALLLEGVKANCQLQPGGPLIQSLRPDAKSQVTICYRNGTPVGVQAVVLSWQHQPEHEVEEIRQWLERQVIDRVTPHSMRTPDFVAHINPAGSFTRGGPKGDTGLTGRKIVADTYGGAAPHGGGAFSGKDPSKVDRSAAYAARWVAKNVVAAGLARKATVQIAYAIGHPEPVSVNISTHGTGKVADAEIANAIRQSFDLSPEGIIAALDLKRPIYADTAAYGHFGAARDPARFPWEGTDRAEVLRLYCGA